MAMEWVQKIEALMAKATNAVTSEEERATLMEKAFYLMSKYSIEETMLNFRNEVPEEVSHRMMIITEPYGKFKGQLLFALSRLSGCKVVLDRSGKYSIFGYERDQLNTIMLYGSVIVQMFADMAVANAEERPKGMHGKTFNTSWLAGFVFMIRERVQNVLERVREETKATGNGMELVLVEKQDKIDKLVNTVYSRLRSTTSNTRVSYGDAYYSGQAAGSRADLGQTRIGKSGHGNLAIGN